MKGRGAVRNAKRGAICDLPPSQRPWLHAGNFPKGADLSVEGAEVPLSGYSTWKKSFSPSDRG